MSENEKQKLLTDAENLGHSPSSPLVFISHDGRDAEIAEAFSKLLKSVSAGMIKSFRSSDKKGNDGIDFGDEWYKRLMNKLQLTSDVVCLFTERSLDRPWILFEAGVAKARMSTPVIGIALGVPLSRVSTGPFYQFQNMEDTEDDLTKLVHQLAKRIPSLELDHDVVKVQVEAFKKSEAAILKNLAGTSKGIKPETEDSPVAKLVEEMKALPSRVAERLFENGDPFRARRGRRYHPLMLEQLVHLTGSPGEPIGVLMAASLVRDDAPWIYELAMEVYKAIKSGDNETIEMEISRLRKISEFTMHSSFMEELGFGGKESRMFFLEFPRMLESVLQHSRTEGKLQRSPHRISVKPLNK